METTKKENIWFQMKEVAKKLFGSDENEEQKALEEAIQEMQGYETPRIKELEKIVDSNKETKGGKTKSSFAEGLKVKSSPKVKSSSNTRNNEGKTLGDE